MTKSTKIIKAWGVKNPITGIIHDASTDKDKIYFLYGNYAVHKDIVEVEIREVKK